MTQVARNIYPVEQNNFVESAGSSVQANDSAKNLFNRELSLLEFFRRVLEEAQDETQPLLERLKFISILSSNLDEFFMIRVSSLKEKHIQKPSADGMTAAEQLAEIRNRVSGMIETQMRCLTTEILPALSQEGITIAEYKDLNESEREYVNRYYETRICPILTPQAVDPSHPFPYISGGSLNIGLFVKPKVNRRVEKAFKRYNAENEFFVRIEVPSFIPRFIEVAKGATKYVLSGELIMANIQTLVPEGKYSDCFRFRITRDGDIGLREEEAEDLLQMMEENLKQRRFGDIVRLEAEKVMPKRMIEYLSDSMKVDADDLYLIDGPINLADFMDLYKIDRPELKDKPLNISTPPIFQKGESTFDLIKRQDVLLHHPYMPYSIVTDFIAEAAKDPDVLAIKMCLYRVGANSPIVPLLIEASERGKQVTVLIELKARFDEENNIEWAKRLEQAGVHVIYGILGLKTHAKTTLIIRREGEELQRYLHIATGNYNPQTSAFYTDLGLLTDDKEMGEDATELFNFLSAYSQSNDFRKLLAAPVNLREKMLEMIKREAEHARQGKPARIIAKFNRLADVQMTEALYEASQAGVQIDLIIRGICILRPGVEGLSDNIRVRSVVGPLLEHSRVYYFANGGNDEIYLGSSDWMPRNLDRRVEVIAPIEDESIKKYLKDEFLTAYLRDNVKARVLHSDGTYEKPEVSPNQEPFNSQISFQERTNVIDFYAKH